MKSKMVINCSSVSFNSFSNESDRSEFEIFNKNRTINKNSIEWHVEIESLSFTITKGIYCQSYIK